MTDEAWRARRKLLHVALATAATVVAAPVHLGVAQTKKYTKEQVGYRDEPYLGRSCAKCVLYAGHGECAIVQGAVSQDGWCVQWTPATMGSTAGPA